MTLSKNGAALFVLALSIVGIDVAEDSVLEVIAALTTIGSFVVMIWNQANRPDVKRFFWKK